MQNVVSDGTGILFKAPKRSLGDLEADTAARVISAASDVAVVVDKKGVIRDVAFGSEEMSQEGYSTWLGQHFVDTVTIESREKIEELLREAAANSASRWRQVNHPSPKGIDVPVRYSAVSVGEEGRVVAVGRDLRSVATLQQKLVEAQQSMEREYARLRHAETRYRLLFQIASEPVIIINSSTDKVVDANPAAVELFGTCTNQSIKSVLKKVLGKDGVDAVKRQLDGIRSSGRADAVTVRSFDDSSGFDVSSSLFRQDETSNILIRISPLDTHGRQLDEAKSNALTVIEKLPDGFVVTDPDRRILMANAAFLDLVQLAAEEQARGQLLSRWLGRSEVDLNVLMANVREHGAVRHFGTVMRGDYGSTEEVDISAVSVLEGDTPCFGFTIRSVGRRVAALSIAEKNLPRSVEQLTELVGRVPLKDLVRDTTDIIERLCIEAALELTGDNRASAAEMLGLSRQSLYVKLHRFGIVEPDQDGENNG